MILGPNDVYLIAAIALAYSVFSTLVMSWLGNPKRLAQLQKQSNDIQKRLQEALKSKDDHKISAATKEYDQTLMPLMKETLILQFKPMLVILPTFILLSGLVRDHFKDFIITLPFQLPIFIQNLEKFPNWRDTFGVIGWFLLCILVWGLAISIIKSLWEKYNQSKTQPAPDSPDPSSKSS
ncbi:MAG: EMC3/TMCO1 family protein [Candidatus Micrarchaeota archaeon]